MDFTECGKPGGIREIRQNADHSRWWLRPRGTAFRTSTPIIDAIEKLYPEPSIHPDDAVANFISALIEEFGDEWGNKWMFHYRWARDVDQISSAGRIARMRGPKAGEQEHEAFAGQVRARMVDRVWFVGSNAVTAPQIEAGFLEMLGLLDSHLASRPYLFGRTAGVRRLRPVGADSTKCGPIPTAGALIEGDAPHVLDWVHRMLWPKAEGAFESWSTLAADPDADPDRAGRRAIHAVDVSQRKGAGREAKEEFSVSARDKIWTQKPQKYHADRSACCVPDMQKSPTRPRSIPFWRPPAALLDYAAEFTAKT